MDRKGFSPGREEAEAKERASFQSRVLEERANILVNKLFAEHGSDLSYKNASAKFNELKRNFELIEKNNLGSHRLDEIDKEYLFDRLKEKIFLRAYANEVHEIKDGFNTIKPIGPYTLDFVKSLLEANFPNLTLL